MPNQGLGEDKGESVDVKEYLAILLKRKWLVLVCFLLSMACTTAFLFTRQPIYRASAKLFISKSGRSTMTTEVVEETDLSFYSTAGEVMRSQSMLRRVQQRMRKTSEELRENLANLLIRQQGSANIIVVTVDSPSRDFAREFANALCDEFLRFRDEEQAKHQESALLTLTREINRLSQELRGANDRIQTYARQNDLSLLESDPELSQQKYLGTISGLKQATAALAAAQYRKNRLDGLSDSASVVAALEKESNSGSAGSAVSQPADAEVRALGIGSIVNIQVNEAADLSLRTVVGSDGMIDFGQLGRIQAAGLTPAALATNIQRRLSEESQLVSAVRITSPTPIMETAGAESSEAPDSKLSPNAKIAAPSSQQGDEMQTLAASRYLIYILPELRARQLFSLENQRRSLLARRDELAKIYQPKHPAMVKVQQSLDSVVTSIDREVDFLRERTAFDLQTAKERYQKLQASLGAVKEEAINVNVKRSEIGTLRAEAARISSLHNALLGRLLNIDVIEHTARTVSVLEYAIAQNDPIYPNKSKGLLVAAFVGLGLGLALAYFIEYIDDSIKLAEEVERDLQLPFLGMIPAAQWSPSDLSAHRLDKLKQQGGVAEAYRVVRSAVIFSTPRDKLRSILLTSAVPREGKTTTCVNLSIGFAQIEERVLLIDADLRRGETHKYFGLDRGKGLADVLLGEMTVEQVIHHTNVPKLDVITCGAYPANPAELLLGWRLKELLDWAHKSYDRVIIDCPPVMGIADSAILGAAVDGVIFIIWAGRTSRRYVRVAKMTAVGRGAKIFGFVLNNLEPGRVGYYHYYPYYYSYYSHGYYYHRPDDEKGKGGSLKGIEVPTPEGGEEKIDDVY